MGEQKQKLVYLCTHGPEDPEKAILPFSMALGAMAMDFEAVVILQSGAVLLAMKCAADHVLAAGMSPLKEQLDIFLADGGKLIACTACLSARKIEKGMLDERIQVGSVASLAKEFSEATNVICY
jgi:uncharacterized protein involved in oxidation of intracellular sulfur